LQPFGPAVVPPLTSQELTGLFDARSKWTVTTNVAAYTRRSIYLVVRRTFLYPMFAAFDPPEVMTSCPQRLQTAVPTQALTLLNSPLAREQAGMFAHRLLRDSGTRPEKIGARAWLLAFNRSITPKESDHAGQFLRKQAEARGGLEPAHAARLAASTSFATGS
jgi:hypothetical protein